MDYKEKYEQALERAKVINPGTADYEVAVKIFPELKSEDERIRKALLNEFIHLQSKGYKFAGLEGEEIVTWLEKQKDHEDELERAYKCADEVQYRRGYEAAKREFEKQGEHKCDCKHVGCHVNGVKRWCHKKQAEIPYEECNIECSEYLKQDDISLTENELEALRIAAYEPVKNWSEKLQSLYLKLCRTQIEQKPGKVKPKFKVGDWITDNTSTFQIVEIRDEWYIADDGDRVCFNIIDQYYHLWTIQDAKSGDVLVWNDCGDEYIFVFDKLIKDYAHAFIGFDVYLGTIETKEDVNRYYQLNKLYPATKEQRNLLFQKMKEAAYEFDFGKKELKKIEQKPTDKKYTFKAIPRLLSMIQPTDKARAYCRKLIDSLIQEGYGADAKIVGNCLKQMNNENVTMATMNEQKPNFCHHEVDFSNCSEEYRKAYYDGWNNCNQQHAQLKAKQESFWNEEDEKMINSIIKNLDEGEWIDIYQADWLKSLKDRMKENVYRT